MIASGFRRAFASKPSGERLDGTRLLRVATIAAGVLDRDCDPATVAIPFLHVQSAHPNATARYQTLLDNPDDWRNRAHVALTRIGMPILSVLGNSLPWSGDALPDQADVVFVSHFLRASDASGDTDLYFGDLPKHLEQTGISSVTGLINHSREPWRRLAPQWGQAATPRVLFNRTLSLATELDFDRRLKHAANRLKKNEATEPLARAVHAAAAATAAGSASRTAMRLAKQIGQLVARVNPKALVTTFEGHSWERLVYAAARAASPGLLCVGYSHAVLFPFQHAMALRLGHDYDPDVVLTAGDVTRDRLREEPTLTNVPIETLGSVRRSEWVATDATTRGPICLVVPEGLVSECVLLMRVAADAATLVPQVRFRIRLHPVIKRDDIFAADRSLSAMPSNVEWSTASLDDDLHAARWTIYRGSSVVIQAVRQGVRPLYFASPHDAFDLDPLAALSAWRERFATADQLAAILTYDCSNAATPQNDADASLARDFCERYFMPMQPAVLTEFMRQRGLR